MQRWFFADEQTNCNEHHSASSEIIKESSSSSALPSTKWKFCVRYDGELCANERLAVIGNIEVLGKWNISSCLPMDKEQENIWSVSTLLSRKEDVFYRYLVIAIDGRGYKLLRFWESHIKPRRILRSEVSSENEDSCHCLFGDVLGINRVQRGWLQYCITAVQFKLFKCPVILQSKHKNTVVYFKITPIRLRNSILWDKIDDDNYDNNNDNDNDDSDDNDDNDQNQKSPGKCKKLKHETSTNDPTEFAFCEVATLNNDFNNFHYQSQYGTPCGDKDLLLFNVILGDFQNTAYLIDLYRYPPKAAPDILPYHVGYQYIRPEQLTGWHGSLKLNVMCASKHRQIGYFTMDYLVVHPYYHSEFSIEESISQTWYKTKKAVHIAHRGCGKSFFIEEDFIRENTLKSFNMAIEHGADMIEFDVHLTKDKVPIIHHDLTLQICSCNNFNADKYDVFYIPLTKAEKIEILKLGQQGRCGITKVPIKHFKNADLQKIKGFDLDRDFTFVRESCVKNFLLNKPFPTLQTALNDIPETVPFNIELKWPTRLENGKWEYCSDDGLDMNEFLDVILHTVIKHRKRRSIIFSSFSADICSMMQLKQRFFPTFYMVKGEKHHDPRGKNLVSAASFAYTIELCGIAAASDKILEKYSNVFRLQRMGLRIIAFGTDIRYEKVRQKLAEFEVDGFVYDRINHALEGADVDGTITIIRDAQTSCQHLPKDVPLIQCID